MKKIFIYLLLLMFFSAGAFAQKNEPGPALETLEQLVRQYVDLRAGIAAEKREWNDRKSQLQKEIELLEVEKAKLEKEIEQTEKESSVGDKAQAELEKERDQLKRIRSDLTSPLDKAGKRAIELSGYVPSALMPELKKALAEIRKSLEKPGELSPERRLQVLSAYYSQLENILNSIHVTKELLALGGTGQREMDVIYTGLARAFAVSPDSQTAAVGVPGKGGWSWTENKALAPEVRKAIQVFNRQVPAELLALPMSIESGGKDEE